MDHDLKHDQGPRAIPRPNPRAFMAMASEHLDNAIEQLEAMVLDSFLFDDDWTAFAAACDELLNAAKLLRRSWQVEATDPKDPRHDRAGPSAASAAPAAPRPRNDTAGPK